MFKSYKTTMLGLFGILAAVCHAGQLLLDSDPLTNPDFGAVGTAIAIGLGLIFARDNNVTSEESGATTAAAKRKTAPPILLLCLLPGLLLVFSGCASNENVQKPEIGPATSKTQTQQKEAQDVWNHTPGNQNWQMVADGRKPVQNTNVEDDATAPHSAQQYFEDKAGETREKIAALEAALENEEGEQAEKTAAQIAKLKRQLEHLELAGTFAGSGVAPAMLIVGDNSKVGNFIEQTPSTGRDGSGASATLTGGPASTSGATESALHLEQTVKTALEAIAAWAGGQATGGTTTMNEGPGSPSGTGGTATPSADVAGETPPAE